LTEVLSLMKAREKETPEATSRVVIYSQVQPRKEIYGYGRYIGEERGDIAYEASFGHPVPESGIKAWDGKIYFPKDYEKVTTPKFLMDSGEIVYGYKYWWAPV